MEFSTLSLMVPVLSAEESGPGKVLGKCIKGLFQNPGKTECQRSSRAVHKAPKKLRMEMTESIQTVVRP